MKKSYLLLILLVFVQFVKAQNKNPFDARTNRDAKKTSVSAVLKNAEIIDASKTASTQEFIYKPELFFKPSTPNPYLFILPPGQKTPTVIYRNLAAVPLHYSQSAEMSAFSFLREVKNEMQIENPDEEFTISRVENDDIGMTHVRLQQQYKSIPVYGAEVAFHGLHQTMDYMNGNYVPTPTLTSVTPLKSPAEAVSSMSTHLAKQTIINDLTPQQKQILKYNAAIVTLVILPVENSKQLQYKLAYQIMVRPNFIEVWYYFIDANNLKVLEFYNGTCHVNGPKTATANDLNGVSRTINTYEFNSKFYCVDATKAMFKLANSTFPDQGVGVIETFNANNTGGTSLYNISTTTNTGWTALSTSAHFTAGIAFDYYKNTFNRNSINGQGGTVTSIINVTEANGQAMDNAYWNGTAMFYGNGSVAFKPLAGAIDVGGHEMTHGVIGATANLEYKAQSGAINESMADVFGCMMDRNDWQMGEDITKTSYIATGCLRDLSNPHNGNGNGYQPAKMSEYKNTALDQTGDFGSVHANSGIANFAFYLYATAITKVKAEQVYYRALTLYLTKTSQFLDLRYAIVKAATDLYGAGAAEVTAAKSAFDQVEIFDPNGNTGGGTGGGGTTQTTPNDLPTNPGAEFILSYNLLNGDPKKLYRSSTTGTNFVGLTNTDQNRKVTIPDNGAYCLFADLSGNIIKIDLTASPYTQTTIYNGGDMENIAISKDGKLLAAVTKTNDTAIYIYSFALALWKKVHLYNPTYSGVNAGGVDYADALEWDNTGQYVIYDAHNVTKNNTGADLTYWDVGIVKAWDLKSNNWGDGKIEKLFTNLPEGVSIGNPVFSKNSPYIIAFDEIDNSTATTLYGVLGTNILTNKTTLITANTKLGFPNYSNTDAKLLVDGYDGANVENIYVLNLGADKISLSGSPALVIDQGKWGCWYATGTRSLLSSAKDVLAFSISNTTPAVTATINGTNITAVVPSTTNLTALVATFNLSYDASAKVSSVSQISGLNSNNFSTPVVYTISAQDGTTKNYTVTITKGGAGMTAHESLQEFSLFPNPFNKEIAISYAGAFSYEVFDVMGRNIFPKSAVQMNNAVINTQSLPEGVYFIKLNNSFGSRTLKVVKQ